MNMNPDNNIVMEDDIPTTTKITFTEEMAYMTTENMRVRYDNDAGVFTYDTKVKSVNIFDNMSEFCESVAVQSERTGCTVVFEKLKTQVYPDALFFMANFTQGDKDICNVLRIIKP